MLSLAGLPPFAGFFGKFYLFSVALRAGENHGLLWLVVVALFGSFVSLYYYLIPLRMMFVEKGFDSVCQSSVASRRFVANATIAVLGGAVLLLGILPEPLTDLIIHSLP